MELAKQFKDELTSKAVKMTISSIDFKQPRMQQIRVIEDMLAYKLQPALKGRINIPFDGVIMNGFIDTLCGQINKPPKVVIEDKKGSNSEGAKKTQAFWDHDSGFNKMQLARKDRWSKRLTAISNLGIFEIHAESDPEYKSYLQNIDIYDFIFDPHGGANIEDHLYVGRTNVFKTKDELKNKLYDQTQVGQLVAGYDNGEFKKNQDKYNNKLSRFNSYGLTIDTANYIGQNLYNLTELEVSYKGERYYVLFELDSGIWIRVEKLKDMFESGLYSYQTWQATEHPFMLLVPGPADMIAVIAEAIRVNLNEILNNNRKRNWDMKAVDSTMFPDISQLDWRQDGVVGANVPMNQSLQNGIYYFQTPEISGALNLNTYLNNFVGQNSGVTDQTKGESSQSTLGIANLDNLNLSKRMKLIGDSYTECLAGLVLRWDWNQYEHLEDEYAIKVLGKDGMELTTFSKKDSDPDYDIAIIATDDENNERKLDIERKDRAMDRINQDPGMSQLLNKKWQLEQELVNAGWTTDQVRIAMSKDDYTDELTSKANKAIEDIVLGNEPEDIPDATTGTLEVIHNYLVKNKLKLEPEVKANLEAYFERQAQYADQNAERVANQTLPANQPMPNGQQQPALGANIPA